MTQQVFFIRNSLIYGKNYELSGRKHNILICLKVQTPTEYNNNNNNNDSTETTTIMALLWSSPPKN